MITLLVMILGAFYALVQGIFTAEPWSWLSWTLFLAVIALWVVVAVADLTNYRRPK